MRSWTFAKALLGATALVALIASAGHADPLQDAFRQPPTEARPRVRWWWPGNAVADEELSRQIRLLAETGFAGGEIQSFTPNFVTLTPAEKAVVNDYAEPGFFAHVRAAGTEAERLGLSLDYTLGSAWPSGGGFAIPPEKALVELSMAQTSVASGTTGPITVAIPKRTRRLGALSMFDARVKDPAVADWGKRMDAMAEVVAVVAMKGSAPDLAPATAAMMGFNLTGLSDVKTPGALDPASAILLTDRLRDDGTLDWTPPPGDWQLFVFKRYAADIGVLGAAGRGPQLILDHMNPAAFAAHVARVGDPLGKDPVGLRSTFVDSLELMQDIAWGPDFLKQFKARRGYDLTPYLPFVVQPGWMQAWNEHWSPPYYTSVGDATLADRVRTDFRRTVSDLMFAGFIEPFVAWNHAHGLKAKFQAHGGAFDIIRGYGVVDIPETEDLVHGGDPYFMRLARSAANLYGRPLVSAESLVWKDRPYDVTPDEMRRRVDLLISGGVNSLILHGFNYRFHADDWPGWHAFQPSPFALGFSTMLNETNPVWPAVKPLAAYIGRLQAVMQSGKPIVPVAYFYGRYGYYAGIEDEGAGKPVAEQAFLAGGYDYDRVNPDSILRARVDGRELISRGGHRYGALVLPPVEAMTAEVAERIAAFARAGLPVLFTDRAPDRDDGLADWKRRDARVKQAVAAALAAGAKIVPQAEVIPLLRSIGVHQNLRFGGDASGLVFVQRDIDGRLATFIHNVEKAPRRVTLDLPSTGALERWNAMDGSRAPVSAKIAGDWTRSEVDLAPGESALLLLDRGAKPVETAPLRQIAGMALPMDGWPFSVTGHDARQPYVHDFGAAKLGDWREVPELAHFAGAGTYRRTVTVDPAWVAAGNRLTLDLGEVRDMVTVSVNGQALPPVIASPWRVDVTDAMKAGPNDIAVVIANVPQNATVDPKHPANKKLVPVAAGWMGPARLVVER